MVEIKTPSNYIVYLKRDWITYGEKLALQKIYMKDVKINSKKQDDIDFDASVMFEAQQFLLKCLVARVVKSDGTDVSGDAYAAILEMPEQDGEAVMEKINELTKSLSQEKKS